MDDGYRRLLDYNERWVAARLYERPDYFLRLKDDQRPEYMWIGCSDSRVPAETVTGCQPGDLFVHRNVANLVIHTDLNLLAVLHYAIDVLKVKHVIVCGHYGCGGIRAALGRRSFGLIVNKWLRHVKDVYSAHEAELRGLLDFDARFRRMVELNAISALEDLTHTTVVQQAWREHGRPWLHAWTYDVRTGRLAELAVKKPRDLQDDIYRYEFEE
jgi:carbonic anhydrase